MPIKTTSDWLWLVNEARIWAGVIAAFAAVTAGAAGYAQIRLQTKVSGEKDRAFETFKTTSQLEIARLEKDTAQARRELESERIERLKLQKAMGRRSVTDNQIAILKQRLAGKGVEVSMMHRGVDPEAAMYAKDLEAAFKAAGVVAALGAIFESGPETGIQLHANQSPQLAVFEDALRAADIPFETSAVLPTPGASKRIGLFVGARPVR